MNDLKKIWWFSLLIKLILSALMPLSADEAYYWVWAQRPQLSYFDHPPFVAWLFYIGNFFNSYLNAARWPAVLLGHGLLAVWFVILKDHLPLEKIKNWAWLVLLSPLLGFGSIIVTPDLPVMFFWSLALLFTQRALQNKNLRYYIALGATLGLGFCSKYHIVLFVPCLLAYLSFERRWKDVRWSGVALTIFAGILFSSPVLIWNLQNSFASFEFQIKHGLQKSSYKTEWTITYVLGQILILFPLVFWAALRAKPPREMRWLAYFGWGPLIFFFLTSFRALVEANWPIIAYPSLLALAIFHPKIKGWSKAYLGFFSLITSIVVATLFVPQLRKINYKLEEPYVFQEASSLAKEFQPLYASSYQMAASIWYFSKVPVFKLKDISRYDFFDTLPEREPTGSLFYLINYAGNGLPSWVSEQQWQVKELKKINPGLVLLEISRP